MFKWTIVAIEKYLLGDYSKTMIMRGLNIKAKNKKKKWKNSASAYFFNIEHYFMSNGDSTEIGMKHCVICITFNNVAILQALHEFIASQQALVLKDLSRKVGIV